MKNSIKTLLAAATLCVAAGNALAEDIAIGAVFPMSGPNASFGELYQTATSLAVDHINADKMLKETLVIKYEDSQGLPQPGMIAISKLVDVEKVPYAMVAFSGVSKAVAGVTQRTKTVTANGGAVAPDLAYLGPYFWNLIPLAHLEVPTLVQYLVHQRKLSKFALIFMDDPLGSAIRDQLKLSVSKEGGTLLDAMAVPVGSQQFSGIAAKIRELNPDVVYIASAGAQQNQLIKQLRDNGVKQQIVGYSAFSLPDTNKLPEAKGVLYTSQKIDWASSDTVTKRFVADYKARNKGRQPTAYAANYYNAVRLFALLAGDLEKQKKPIDGDNLLAQRKATKSFDMVGGKMTFMDNGTVLSPIQITEIDGGDGNILDTAAK